MKKCSTCGESKSLDYYNKNSERKDGRQNACRACSNEKSREYYTRNKLRMRSQIYSAKKRRYKEVRQRILKIKSQSGCVVCGETEPVALDFHHIIEESKDSEISLLTKSGASWRRVKEEIEKCEILCANCHRKHHAGVLIRG